MMKHKFTEFIPETLEQGIIYISIEYSTAVHTCVCGCGNEVVTPIAPTDWDLTLHGDSVSLYPSIGNWSFDCKSHYWLKKGKVIHCGRWTTAQIESGRNQEKKRKKKFYQKIWTLFSWNLFS